MKSYFALLLFTLTMGWAVDASAVTIDVIDTFDEDAGLYFLPGGTENPYDDPWFRRGQDDWGWTHNPITDPPYIASATLTITAFDVDTHYGTGEKDEIFANDNGTWVSLGLLGGDDDIWADTTFDLTSDFFDDIANGLEVSMDIDIQPFQNYQYGVALEQSVLTVVGGDPPTEPPPTEPPPTEPPPTEPPPTEPPPTNITIPAPGAILLCGLGAGLVGWTRRRR